ncbi:MAG TPA: amylo-alpha-1,6-glucosidase [Verrucomicrobiales bacterium]|nr:amylo-alpha-1,6-glucosidase [Verrucomicrobiales bacterium]
MSPPAGARHVRFVGDFLEVELRPANPAAVRDGIRARLRTTIGRGQELRREIRSAHFHRLPPAGRAWRDLEMAWNGRAWVIGLPLAEVGFFRAKAYAIDAQGWLHWPGGDDLGINVLPNWCRTANTIYCAFPRMFGPNRDKAVTLDPAQDARLRQLDDQGYTVIPPSGTLHDLRRQLPHIFDTLGCRILHLLPVSPTPTTLARFGRFGSPYALQDLTAIDPALIEFDQRTTGIQQFEELVDAVHLRDGRVIVDLVINHTGWHSTLFERHPEWFVRGTDGKFVSPGAWGTTWADLVEIDPASTELWDELAEAFLVWCRRGVDGFRCDAGYKVPTLVWQYITARVQMEFPESVFLLEGLGGGWDDTAIRLTEGGMQWAYSELFQNCSPAQLCSYLDHTWRASKGVGLLVHYSETHDNDRLAKKGRAWSLLRNRLCALASVNGGFGFTNGVEWLAAEQVNVHSARGLNWGADTNIVAELAELNRLLVEHPCFFDGAKLVRVSTPEDLVLAFLRLRADGAVLVLLNLDMESPQSISWAAGWSDASAEDRGTVHFTGRDGAELLEEECSLMRAAWKQFISGGYTLLLGRAPEGVTETGDGRTRITLTPGGCSCLELVMPVDLVGSQYRDARQRVMFALQAAQAVGNSTAFGAAAWSAIGREANDPESLLTRLMGVESPAGYRPVVRWTSSDERRVTLVPPEHWLLIRLPGRFRCHVRLANEQVLNLESTPGPQDWFAVVPPGQTAGDGTLVIKQFTDRAESLTGTVRFLKPAGEWEPAAAGDPLNHWAAARTVLLTNGRGGMARINLDLGRVQSKYDCVLAANLHGSLPVDRHVFIKRLRLWANADGFIAPLNATTLVWFGVEPAAHPGTASWRFRVQAGDGRSVMVRMDASMPAGENRVAFEFTREETRALDGLPLRLTARLDLEDRNFHWETKRNEGADHHFASNARPLEGRPGFAFTPASDRAVRVVASAGTFHAGPEWSQDLPHPVEASRGQTGSGDGWSPGWFDLPLLEDGASVWLAASAESAETGAFQPAEPRSPAPLADAGRQNADDRQAAFGEQLRRAASQFIVRRDQFKSVIAGYPWFLDWGRDTLICARGMIAGGWTEEVKQLLIVFGRFEEKGTLPNTIHGSDASNRDTSDAPLWYGVVAGELAAAIGDEILDLSVDERRSVRDVLTSIASGYLAGTANGIRVDRESGLVWSPSHFTWMDTNYPAGTPREGYPIEIQALWIRLLRLLARLDPKSEWAALALRASQSLDALYWLEDRGWFADSLIARAGIPAAHAVKDTVLRSNCLFAISLGLVSGERARRCVDAARDHLVVPGAIRSLAPLPAEPPLPIHANGGGLLNDPGNPYWGRYEGDEDTRRKPAYHNGTAWTWPFPVFCEALAIAHGESPTAVAAARSYLGSMDRLLEEGCHGQLPEVVDGDAPHAQRGCDAQAWGATEALRVHEWLNRLATPG